MASRTQWPLPLAVDDSVDRQWLAGHVLQTGSGTWRGTGQARQARLTVTGASHDMQQMKGCVGAGFVLWRHQSRHEVTGNGLTGLLARVVWDFLFESQGRYVCDALAAVARHDTTYCADTDCAAPVASTNNRFYGFQFSVWRRAVEPALTDAPVPGMTRYCEILPESIRLPRGSRGRLCDWCSTNMMRLRSRLARVIPPSGWASHELDAVDDVESHLGSIAGDAGGTSAAPRCPGGRS